MVWWTKQLGLIEGSVSFYIQCNRCVWIPMHAEVKGKALAPCADAERIICNTSLFRYLTMKAR